MTDNVHYLQQDAPVNDNVNRNCFITNKMFFIEHAQCDLLYILDYLQKASLQSLEEKRAVVNVIEDIARRCDKFLEDV
jgi:hypothetical protein